VTGTVLTAIIDTDTINTNHPPATPKCGLIPTRNCREESDTPQTSNNKTPASPEPDFLQQTHTPPGFAGQTEKG
ncbi:MAG: hypothetical protein QOG44_94, partial [Acidimicrobiaceae bacterium]|nr:hypothetical protein [Acidimicrobiaceae bacterium]